MVTDKMVKEDSDLIQFLGGSRFSPSYRLEFDAPQPLISRFDVIKNEFAGQKIVHVGCVDHLSEVDQKIDNGRWIHGCIATVAKQCIGFDINGEGIKYLKRKYAIDNILQHDVQNGPPESVKDETWDVMFMGEVVEHLDNPVSFLTNIRDRWRSRIKKLIVTVPNAFRVENFQYAKDGFEFVNSDHRFWFSPFTIAKLVVIAGYQQPSTRFITGFPVRKSWNLKRLLHQRTIRRYPALRDTLLLSAWF